MAVADSWADVMVVGGGIAGVVVALKLWEAIDHVQLCLCIVLRVLSVCVVSSVLPLCSGATADDPDVSRLPVDRLGAPLPLDEIPLGLGERPAQPIDNRLTPQRVALGRRLFFDPVLSVDGTRSCASCHDPRHGFADPQPISVGVHGARGRRNSPSLLNLAYGTTFFWDGRAATLEAQALQPISNPKEMGSDLSEVLRRLNKDTHYREAFAAAYKGGITADNLARAVASFQRTLLSGNSLVDRFIAGNAAVLTTAQRQGLWLFESRGGCWKCHSGNRYTDESFHNTGVSWGKQPPDLGRYEVTDLEADRGRFKTPSLRNVALTAPYMHDGTLPTLKAVVEFYNRGGSKNPNLDPVMQPLDLSAQQVDALVALLEALTGTPLGKRDD